jgi:hypothetical protein
MAKPDQAALALPVAFDPVLTVELLDLGEGRLERAVVCRDGALGQGGRTIGALPGSEEHL